MKRAKRPHLVIAPLEGVGEIRFGMTRKQVRAAMLKYGLARSDPSDKTIDFFADGALQVEYDGGTASFIGVSYSKAYDCSIYDVNPFNMHARDLFRLLARHDARRARFNRDEYCFRRNIVTLYEADEQYDSIGRGSRIVWGQVGVGDARYLAAIDDLDS